LKISDTSVWLFIILLSSTNIISFLQLLLLLDKKGFNESHPSISKIIANTPDIENLVFHDIKEDFIIKQINKINIKKATGRYGNNFIVFFQYYIFLAVVAFVGYKGFYCWPEVTGLWPAQTSFIKICFIIFY
jgi:hypothetical protein